MNIYQNHSAAELAAEGDFVRWVRHPDTHPELVAFWEKWQKEHPDRSQVVNDARELVGMLTESDQYEGRRAVLWEKIENDLDHVIPAASDDSTASRRISMAVLLKIAAAILVFMLVGTFWFVNNQPQDVATTSIGTKTRIYQNINEDPKTVMLDDGSSVILYQNSKLEILEGFNVTNRPVKIEGKAYFEITRDEQRPFLVRSNNILTEVLGTSFLVSAYDQQDITVTVNTGVVKVSHQNTNVKTSKPITLQRNEAVAYTRKTATLAKVDPASIEVDQAFYRDDFEFDNRKLDEVFSLIESRYGVEISFDEQSLAECKLNASLAGIPLEDKIRLICKASNLSYEVDKDKIIIDGAGCSSL